MSSNDSSKISDVEGTISMNGMSLGVGVDMAGA